MHWDVKQLLGRARFDDRLSLAHYVDPLTFSRSILRRGRRLNVIVKPSEVTACKGAPGGSKI
jgi:hypothetical protein